MNTCAGPECDRPAKALGYCSGHYAQHHRNQPLTPLRTYNRRGTRRCTGPQCRRQPVARNLCMGHWAQWRRTGRTWPLNPKGQGRRGWTGSPNQELATEVEWLTGTDHPTNIAQRLGFKDPATLAKRLQRAGRPDLATHYWKAAA